MYLGFAEYKDLGGTITDETTFNRLEYLSSIDVDYVTANRLKDIDTTDLKPLKMLMLELIEDANIAHTADTMSLTYGGQVSSISNDGVSVSFSGKPTNTISLKNDKSLKQHRYRLIQNFLPQFSYRGLL